MAAIDFRLEWVLAIFYLQVTLMIPTKFKVNWSFISGEAKNRFSRWPAWRHLGLPIGTILAIFEQQGILMLPTKFQVN